MTVREKWFVTLERCADNGAVMRIAESLNWRVADWERNAVIERASKDAALEAEQLRDILHEAQGYPGPGELCPTCHDQGWSEPGWCPECLGKGYIEAAR